jgi:cytochrome c
MKRAALIVFLAAIMLVFGVTHAQKEQKAEKMMTPAEAMEAAVKHGKELFSDPRLGTNGKTCNDCHVNNGTKQATVGDMVIRPFDKVNDQFPMYWPIAGRVVTLDQVVNWCIKSPLQGTPLTWDDPDLTDLVAFCASVTPAPEPVKEEITD